MADEYKNRKTRKEKEVKKKKQMKAALIAIICFVVVTAISIAAILIVKKVQDGDKGNTNTSTASDDNSGAAEEEVVDESGKIADGITIDGVAVGGMEFEEACETIEKHVSPVYEKELTIDVSGNTSTIPLKNLDVACDVKGLVDQAFILSEGEGAEKSVDVELTINDSKLDTFIKDECSQYTKKAKNATMKRKNGEFTISKSKKGTSINLEGTRTAVHEAINVDVEKTEAVYVKAVLDKIDPEYSTKTLKQCTSLLGKFSTSFSEGQVQRSANIRNAVSFINGTIVYPGETFSVSGTINPLTESNGYHLAPSYQGGQVIDSLGGGVCQVSTTLYNAALLAEMKIVDRSCHSMMVTYVKPSFDAAIAGDYKDMKFENNLDYPVYIAGAASGGVLTFSIYGKETRPSNRTIKYESVVTQTIQPGEDVVTKDDTQPETYEKVTQSAHVGYVADLYKIVYVDGVEQSREQVNHSRYKAEPRHVTVGTKKEDEDKDKDKKKKKKNSKKSSSDDSDETVEQTEPSEPAVTEETPQDTGQPADVTEQPPEV